MTLKSLRILTNTSRNERLGNLVACAVRECRQCILHHHPTPHPSAKSSHMLDKTTESDFFEDLATLSDQARCGQNSSSPSRRTAETADGKTHGVHGHRFSPIPPFSPSSMPLLEKQMVKAKGGVVTTLTPSDKDLSSLPPTPSASSEQCSNPATTVDEQAAHSRYSSDQNSSTPSEGTCDCSFAETAGWLFRLVFQSAAISQRSMDTITGHPNIHTNSHPLMDANKAPEAYRLKERSMADFECTDDMEHTFLLPPADYLYGLSIGHTVRNLLQTWTYIKPCSLPINLLFTDDDVARYADVLANDSDVVVTCPEDEETCSCGNEGTIPLSANDLYTMDYSEDEDEDEEDFFSARSTPPKLLVGIPAPVPVQLPDIFNTDHLPEVQRKNKDPDSSSLPSLVMMERRDQPSESLSSTIETMLKQLEQTVRKTGEDAKKAEKSRQHIEAFKKTEQDARFARLEGTLMLLKEAWKTQQIDYGKLRNDAEQKTTRLQAHEDERFARLEDTIISQSNAVKTSTTETLALIKASAQTKVALADAEERTAHHHACEEARFACFENTVISQSNIIKTCTAEIVAQRKESTQTKDALAAAEQRTIRRQASEDACFTRLEDMLVTQIKTVKVLVADFQMSQIVDTQPSPVSGPIIVPPTRPKAKIRPRTRRARSSEGGVKSS
jgi:hypothetical protein